MANEAGDVEKENINNRDGNNNKISVDVSESHNELLNDLKILNNEVDGEINIIESDEVKPNNPGLVSDFATQEKDKELEGIFRNISGIESKMNVEIDEIKRKYGIKSRENEDKIDEIVKKSLEDIDEFLK